MSDRSEEIQSSSLKIYDDIHNRETKKIGNERATPLKKVSQQKLARETTGADRYR